MRLPVSIAIAVWLAAACGGSRSTVPRDRPSGCGAAAGALRVDVADDSPFARLGGADRVRALVERFYDVMSEREPALARLHPCTPEGRVERGPRDRFGLFLIGWLGGPDDYVAAYGHPRLRMRHVRVAVDLAMRDAWLRCMTAAMDDTGVTGELRQFLDERFAEVADFMRNVEG